MDEIEQARQAVIAAARAWVASQIAEAGDRAEDERSLLRIESTILEAVYNLDTAEDRSAAANAKAAALPEN